MLLFRGEDEYFVGVSHLDVAVLSWEESHEARHEVRGHWRWTSCQVGGQTLFLHTQSSGINKWDCQSPGIDKWDCKCKSSGIDKWDWQSSGIDKWDCQSSGIHRTYMHIAKPYSDYIKPAITQHNVFDSHVWLSITEATPCKPIINTLYTWQHYIYM